MPAKLLSVKNQMVINKVTADIVICQSRKLMRWRGLSSENPVGGGAGDAMEAMALCYRLFAAKESHCSRVVFFHERHGTAGAGHGGDKCRAAQLTCRDERQRSGQSRKILQF